MTKKESCELDREINNFIAKKLLTAKRQLGLTQKQISEVINVSTQQIHKYCIGTNRISAAKLFLFAKCFNLSIDFFFPKNEIYENTSCNLYELKQSFDEMPQKEKLEFLAYSINNLSLSNDK